VKLITPVLSSLRQSISKYLIYLNSEIERVINILTLFEWIEENKEIDRAILNSFDKLKISYSKRKENKLKAKLAVDNIIKDMEPSYSIFM